MRQQLQESLDGTLQVGHRHRAVIVLYPEYAQPLYRLTGSGTEQNTRQNWTRALELAGLCNHMVPVIT